MAWNSEEEKRIQLIEEKLNQIQLAMNSLVNRQTVVQLTNIRQREIIELQEKVASLETQVAALQS